MSNKNVVSVFGSNPVFSSMMKCAEDCEGKYEELKTFFTNYRNPIGIEVEVEGFRRIVPPDGLTFWRCIEDGSLKYYGREYVSYPIGGRYIDYAIKELADAFEPLKGCLVWSHRTSIHVHVNMSTIKMNQLTAFVALYGLYERIFFFMVNEARRANPYCYPATSVNPLSYVNVEDDNKYCALNLAPLQKYGTVEFRHMHGTDDWRTLRRWIQLIVKLHAFVDRQDSTKVLEYTRSLLEGGDFVGLFKTIFGASAGLFSEEHINKSANYGAMWSAAILERGFD